jgi:hypothetical protein
LCYFVEKVGFEKVSKKGPFTRVATVSAVAASEANYGVGVQVKIHPPREPFSRGPLPVTERNFETFRKEILITKKISEKI